MNSLLKKSLGQSKKVIILTLVCLALLCGCREREKTIYKVPLRSSHTAEFSSMMRMDFSSEGE